MKFPRFLLVLLLASTLAGADTIREALVNLCDPAKIATITSERGANPRVRKIAYWLEMARLDGRDPSAEMREVVAAVGWGGSAKGELTADAMVRNRVIAERLGCLDDEGMTNLPLIGTHPEFHCASYRVERGIRGIGKSVGEKFTDRSSDRKHLGIICGGHNPIM